MHEPSVKIWPLALRKDISDERDVHVCGRGITYVMICMVICTVTSYIALKYFKMLPPTQ